MPTMKNSGDLITSISTDLADNNAGLISAEDVRHKTLFAYESILARVLGKSTSNDLAQFLNLPFKEGVTARYSTNDVDILTGDGTAPPVTEKTPETPDEAEARTRKNVALDNQIAARAETG